MRDMAERKKMVQTTIRLDPDVLREAQYYLSLEGISLARFVADKVKDFIKDYRSTHPERVPGGVHDTHTSRNH
jgi:hypothetical protein